jgi:hypothetical protein
MAAHSCMESHLWEFDSERIDVVVVRDAIAGPRLPDGDEYLATIINLGGDNDWVRSCCLTLI